MARGDGSIYQTKDGMWVAALVLPPDPVTGKMRRKVMKSKDKQAVKKKLAAAKRELTKSGDLPTASPTLSAWLDWWLTNIAKNQLKPRVWTTYQGYVERYLKPAIGKVRVERLTTDHVTRLHKFIIEDRKLSSTTARQAHWILVSALNEAVRRGRANRNVAQLVKAPPVRAAEARALTADEAIKFLVATENHPLSARWALALFTGCRQGEALGASIEHLNLEEGWIDLAWQVQRLTWQHGCGERAKDKTWPCGKVRAGACPSRHVHIPPDHEHEQMHGGLWLLRPKTKGSWRRVALAEPLRLSLIQHVSKRRPERLLFTTAAGHPIDPGEDHREWEAALEAAGVPDVPLHAARHTTSTLLQRAGVDERTRMQILGHSSATTNARYTHIDLTMQRDAMQRFTALLDAARA